MRHVLIDYPLFSELCYRVLESVRAKEKIYRGILCPLKGGFYLSYFMGRHLELPIEYLEINSYRGREQDNFRIGVMPLLEEGAYLLCDDIYDTGNTIGVIRDMYPQAGFDIACLVTKDPKAEGVFAMAVEPHQWVDFFWEVL